MNTTQNLHSELNGLVELINQKCSTNEAAGKCLGFLFRRGGELLSAISHGGKAATCPECGAPASIRETGCIDPLLGDTRKHEYKYAPPSGEGVVPLYEAEMAVQSAYRDLGFFRQNELLQRLRTLATAKQDAPAMAGSRCIDCHEPRAKLCEVCCEMRNTTPQSAPVDGELARIGELIRTQDNRITDQPIFIVQQKREYVAHPDYDHDLIAWFDGDGEANEEEAAALEAQYKDTHREPAGWTRAPVGYYWEFVTACFTEQGCKDYIARDGHNLKEPRIYAAGSYRNAEWRTVRNYLAGLTTPQSAPVDEVVRYEPLSPTSNTMMRVVDAVSPDWAKRGEHPTDWINELGTLGQHPNSMPHWVRTAIKTIYHGLTTTPPPASQERGGDLLCKLAAAMREVTRFAPSMVYRGSRMEKAWDDAREALADFDNYVASPPSSAASK